MESFGEKLRTLRKQHNLTARKLAAILEIREYGYIHKIEVGRKEPSIEFINKVSNFFNVSIEKLVNDELELD